MDTSLHHDHIFKVVQMMLRKREWLKDDTQRYGTLGLLVKILHRTPFRVLVFRVDH